METVLLGMCIRPSASFFLQKPIKMRWDDSIFNDRKLKETEGHVNVENSLGSIQQTFSLLLCFMGRILCYDMTN